MIDTVTVELNFPFHLRSTIKEEVKMSPKLNVTAIQHFSCLYEVRKMSGMI